MPTQKQTKKSTQDRQGEAAEVTPQEPASTEKLKADLDSILDEIDEVLEENAEQFVAQYVQRGGE